MNFDEAIVLWRDGERRLAQAAPDERAALERVVQEVVAELRRRRGGPFTAQELADYYGAAGSDWIFELAVRAAPDHPSAWDITTVAGAAFARYVKEASDYGGGRRIVQE